jgi:hypothetical protein
MSVLLYWREGVAGCHARRAKEISPARSAFNQENQKTQKYLLLNAYSAWH